MPLTEAEIREKLENSTPFYAKHCLQIIDKRDKLIRLGEPKPAQLKLDRAIQAQDDAGQPGRVIVLKARRQGISTWAAVKGIQRVTMRENHKALVVAHDKKTAGMLFEMAEIMYGNLPEDEEGNGRVVDGLNLKPPTISQQRATELRLGEPSRVARQRGERGINSSYRVDTANEFQGGRGFAYTTIHISELAFWANVEKKLTSLLNTVPNEPGTLVIMESTANGYNRFRKLWTDALEGHSDYAPVFIAWFEDPDYVRRFANEEERQSFIATIGNHRYGDAEPNLVENYGLIPEQLNWRRWAIGNLSQGDIRAFEQEYPASWEEAFMSTGRQVFAPPLVSAVVGRCEKTDPEAEEGVLEAQSMEVVERLGRRVEIPNDAKWVSRAERDRSIATRWWRVWEHPQKDNAVVEVDGMKRKAGQYVIFVDSASGEETESGDPDYHVIEVIDHITRKQVAEFRARNMDPDLVADEAYKAARYFNDAWLAVETTGGYGLSIAQKLWKRYRYPMLYRRKSLQQRSEKQEQRLGWDTNSASKALLVDHMKELLREGVDGVRSKHVAGEMVTFVKDEKGRYGAEADEHDDCIMAYMGAQYVAAEKPLKTARKKGHRVTTTGRAKVLTR